MRILTPVMLTYLMLLPFLCSLILYRNKAKLNQKATRLQWGSLYMNFETNKNSAYHFTMLFFYRRLLLAFVLAFCQVSVVLQVQILIYSSLGLLIYLLKWMPMESKKYNFVVILNESVLLVCSYLLMLFTEYVPITELRY